jgi:hypothetical protein
LRQVKQNEGVAKRVCHDGQPANRDVEGLGHHLAAGRPDLGGCLVGGSDKPVWFITLPGCEDGGPWWRGGREASSKDTAMNQSTPSCGERPTQAATASPLRFKGSPI